MNSVVKSSFLMVVLLAPLTITEGADARSVPPFSGMPFETGATITSVLGCIGPAGKAGGGELAYTPISPCPSSMEWIWPLTADSGGPFTVEAQAGPDSGTIKCEAYTNSTNGMVSGNSSLVTLSTASLTTITTSLTLPAGGNMSLVCTFEAAGSVTGIDWF
jgi:hypothetical protein